MDLGLKGRVALVAAASKGLGRAVAHELAAEGARLAICARDAGALEAAAREIAATTGAEVLARPADVSDPNAIAAFVDATLERFGRVDVLVTNSGGPPPGRFEAHDAAAWQKATELTLFAPVEFARRVLPGMRERRWGRILNVTSIAVKQPIENLMLSNSLRAAVTGWARTLANEVAREGVTVNNLMPGYTRTDRVEALAQAVAKREGLTPAEATARWEREIPMGRLGDVREFAALAAFLASERASYITGTSIPVDGGWIRSLL
ncbi:MAG TPA: SDR family oxidoreductase [Candidatus Eisenbacteria bacterium]|jgi:3-oxoacyl-[acyl-carrier protein] reductase